MALESARPDFQSQQGRQPCCHGNRGDARVSVPGVLAKGEGRSEEHSRLVMERQQSHLNWSLKEHRKKCAKAQGHEISPVWES